MSSSVNTMKKKRGTSSERFLSFDSLPNDIIQDVLLRLDVKSLRICECVCKSWKTLIRQPSFINNHLKRQSSSVIIYSTPSSYRRLSESFDEIEIYDRERFPTAASLVLEGGDKGVLCLSQQKENKIYLWNPATNEFKTLPLPPPCSWQDPFVRFGFGYDPSANEFKVVRVCSRKFLKWFHEISVYGWRSNSWKRMEMPNLFFNVWILSDYNLSVVVSGSIHWVAHCADDDEDVGFYYFGIVAFDVSKEHFKLIDPPQGKQRKKFLTGKLNECLSLVVGESHYVWKFDIWVMKEYGVSDSWIKQVKVDMNSCLDGDLRFPQPHKEDWVKLLAFGNKGNVLLQFRFNLFWYDLESHRVKYLYPDSLKTAFVHLINYAETIIHI